MAVPSEVRNLDRMLWKKEQDRSREELLAPGNVEILVLEGRVLFVVDDFLSVFIPPQGVRIGDSYHVYTSVDKVEFFRDDKSMGFASFLRVDRGEGENILMRTNKTLERIGMLDLDAPLYIGIDEEELHQLKSAPKE
ncbi:MAG: hypothetical protein A3A51_02610 [Candidatus Levybacteria bacterium RIFCSPLOWO2_01_FULL_39_10]|nr:MAG: hypothetical protein A3A51_02610 [Candidatus Levybacteria bacterium RIFCSPLOWO2_01_FULL_39_10]